PDSWMNSTILGPTRVKSWLPALKTFTTPARSRTSVVACSQPSASSATMSLEFIGAHVRESAVTTQAFSPAKINLYLRIVGRRPDGYHELETVMLPVDFGDTMTFEARPAGIELSCDDPCLPVDDSTLRVRAGQLLGL